MKLKVFYLSQKGEFKQFEVEGKTKEDCQTKRNELIAKIQPTNIVSERLEG